MYYKFTTLLVLLLAAFVIESGQSQNDLHHRDQSLPCLNKTIHLYTYVVLNKDREFQVTYEDLARVVEETNVYFEPICLNFKLCEIDTIEDYFFRIMNEGSLLFSEMNRKHRTANRLNLYLIGRVPSGCGFSELACVQTPENAYSVLEVGCLMPKLLAQEFGTVFGLKDTNFGNREELVNGSNCATAGDEICDTPADPYRKPHPFYDYVRDCEFIYPHPDPNGQYYQPLVSNIMSPYYLLDCTCSFTYDQYVRMVETYENSPKKLW